jgi:hypothetical protein
VPDSVESAGEREIFVVHDPGKAGATSICTKNKHLPKRTDGNNPSFTTTFDVILESIHDIKSISTRITTNRRRSGPIFLACGMIWIHETFLQFENYLIIKDNTDQPFFDCRIILISFLTERTVLEVIEIRQR